MKKKKKKKKAARKRARNVNDTFMKSNADDFSGVSLERKKINKGSTEVFAWFSFIRFLESDRGSGIHCR